MFYQVDQLNSKTAELLNNQRELHVQYMDLRDTIRQLSLSKLPEVAEVDNCASADMSDFIPSGAAHPNSRLSFISVMTADSVVDSAVDDEEMRSSSMVVNKPDSEPLCYPLPDCQLLPKELYPTHEQSEAYYNGLEFVMKAVGPTEKQLQQRDSSISWIKRQVRIALGAATFEIGLHATHTLLPDDPIKLDVIVSKSLLLSWHVMLCERLHMLSEKAAAYGGTLFIPPDEEDSCLDAFFNESVTLLNHTLGAVSHTKQNLNHTVHLMMDSIAIEIIANSRTEFCLMSFYEDVCDLVGDHLFKKTFLLVRAWWAMETPSYVGTSIRHYLSDAQLLVMLTAIFNRYSDHITSPLQALCYFLCEYANYDGNSQVITVQGIVGFQTRASNQPAAIDATTSHFLSDAFLDKHWELFNINITIDDSSTVCSATKRPSGSSEEAQDDPVPGAAGAAANISSNDSVGKGSPSHTMQSPAMVKEGLKQLSMNNLHHFDRSSFNILHPLNHTNMITEKLSVRRVNRIIKAFQMGASNLTYFLRRVKESNADAAEAITNYFPNVLSTYHNRIQGDETSLEDLLVSKDAVLKMQQCVNYYDLIMEAIVSEGALQCLAMEILATKGPLPVGEIGKILADITSIPNLSQKLKEKFGGLKKFLELFPMSFVISNDHPFNPNVLLRSSLSAEHLEMIDKGMFPPQLLVRPKKVSLLIVLLFVMLINAQTAANKKKKAPAANFPAAHAPEVAFRSDFGGPLTTTSSSGNLQGMNIIAPALTAASLPNATPYRMPMNQHGSASSPMAGMKPTANAVPMQGMQTNQAMKQQQMQQQQQQMQQQQMQHQQQFQQGRKAQQPKVQYSPHSSGYYPNMNIGDSAYYGNAGYRPNQGGQYGYNQYGQYDGDSRNARRGSGSQYPDYNGHSNQTSMESSMSTSSNPYAQPYYPQSGNSSNSNSYNSNNAAYVATLLQAVAPEERSGSYSNSFLSQLRMDSVEVGQSYSSSFSQSSPQHEAPERRTYADSLFPVDESPTLEPAAPAASGGYAAASTYVSRLFLK